MNILKIIVSWTWRLTAAGLAHAVGIVLGGGLAVALGLQPLRAPESVDAGGGVLFLLYDGIAIALGLAAIAGGLGGPRWRRWLILGGFAFVVHGVGSAIETRIFTTLGASPAMVVSRLVASFLCALVVALLFRSRTDATGTVDNAFARLSPARRRRRWLLALLAFPASYWIFGMMAGPIVVPYYERLEYLVIPPLSTLLPVSFLRGTLFLLVSIPIVVYWRRSRGRLAVALGLGYAAALGGLPLLLPSTFFPPVVRWTHAVEIISSALCYGLALAWLLFEPPPAVETAESGLADDLPPGSVRPRMGDTP